MKNSQIPEKWQPDSHEMKKFDLISDLKSKQIKCSDEINSETQNQTNTRTTLDTVTAIPSPFISIHVTEPQ